MWVHCLRRPEESIGSLETEVTNAFKLPCGCQKLNLDPPEKEVMPLTSESLFGPGNRHFNHTL